MFNIYRVFWYDTELPKICSALQKPFYFFQKTVSKNSVRARKQHTNLTVKASFLEPDTPEFSSLPQGMCLHRDKTEFTANSQSFLCMLASLQAGKLRSTFMLGCIGNLNGVSHPLIYWTYHHDIFPWTTDTAAMLNINDWKALEILKICYLEKTFAHPRLQIMSVLYLQWEGKSQVRCWWEVVIMQW